MLGVRLPTAALSVVAEEPVAVAGLAVTLVAPPQLASALDVL